MPELVHVRNLQHMMFHIVDEFFVVEAGSFVIAFINKHHGISPLKLHLIQHNESVVTGGSYSACVEVERLVRQDPSQCRTAQQTC